MHDNWYFHRGLSIVYDVNANCIWRLTQSINSLDTLDVMPAPIKQTTLDSTRSLLHSNTYCILCTIRFKKKSYGGCSNEAFKGSK